MSTGKIVIAVAVVAACIGSPIYIHNQVKTKAAGFAQSVDRMADFLPNDFSQTHKQETGFFETTGEYKLFVKEAKEAEIKEVGVVKYKMEHGITHWFSSNYPLNMTLDLNWKEFPEFKILDTTKPYYVFNGIYSTNGDFNVDGVAQDLQFALEDRGTNVLFSGNKMSISYDKESAKTVLKNSVEKVTDEEAGEEMNNFVFKYVYEVPKGQKTGIFDVDMSAENAKQGYAEFKGLNFNMSGGEKDNVVNTAIKVKADKITSVLAGDKVFSFDMEMSLNDLDSTLYNKLAEITDLKTVSDSQAEDLIRSFQKVVDGGFKLNLDKLNISDTQDELKSKFSLILDKKTAPEQTFVNRGSFAANVYLKSPFVSSTINVIPAELRSLMTGKVNEMYLNFLYKNGNVSLNESPLPAEYGEFITEVLLALEESLEETVQEALDDLEKERAMKEKEKTEVSSS